jgi:hypothetical protein
MDLVSRGTTLAAALLACAITAGCGGSVADADARGSTRSAAPVRSPFCIAAQTNVAAIRPLSALVTRGGATPEELSNTVDAVRRAGSAMLDAAPDEIRPDVERTVQATDLQLDALLANGGDGAAVARDPQLNARLGSAEFTGARERVQAYVDANCGSARPAGR